MHDPTVFYVLGLVGAAFILAHLPDDHEACREVHKREVANCES